MKKRIFIAIVICIFAVVCNFADARKKQVVRAVGGTPIQGLSIVIDASYDPKLDMFAPGYKMLNVIIVNNSFNIIGMNPEKDQWWIKTKRQDKKYPVIGDLRSKDAATWNGLSEKARNLVSYPLLLPIGARQVFDLFVPAGVPVEEFQEVDIYIDSLGTTFEILARQ